MLSAGQAIDRWVVRAVDRDRRSAIVEVAPRGALGRLHLLSGWEPELPVLLAERREHAAFRHPNVVRLLDVVAVGYTPALVLEHVDGPTLATLVEQRPPTLEEAEATFRAIVAGVAAGHARGFVFLDLEPASIRVDGTTPRVAGLGRFGIVDHASPSAAPELRAGAPGDVRSDIFSLGCLFYQLCTGHRAFESGAALVARTPSGRRRALPARIGRAIRGCLAPDPDDRIQSCAELLAVLDGTAFPPLHRPQSGLAAVPSAYQVEPQPVPDGRRQFAVGLLGGVPLAATVVGLGFAAGLAVARLRGLPEVAEIPASSLTASLSSGLDAARCAAAPGARVGWVRDAPAADRWRVPEETAVYADRAAGDPLCRLSPGTAVRRFEPPVRAGAAVWTAVYLDR